MNQNEKFKNKINIVSRLSIYDILWGYSTKMVQCSRIETHCENCVMKIIE